MSTKVNGAITLSRLEGAELASALNLCQAWHHDQGRGGTMSRSWEFSNFRMAFAFMTQLAFLAEKLGHHPEWSNVYGHVNVTLTTHDVNGLSMRDVEFARAADKAFESFSPSVRR
jgi:4a-hydroxytetrahydrobiopterin dehydratase